jgi:hypothetical protein
VSAVVPALMDKVPVTLPPWAEPFLITAPVAALTVRVAGVSSVMLVPEAAVTPHSRSRATPARGMAITLPTSAAVRPCAAAVVAVVGVARVTVTPGSTMASHLAPPL